MCGGETERLFLNVIVTCLINETYLQIIFCEFFFSYSLTDVANIISGGLHNAVFFCFHFTVIGETVQ